MGKFKIKELRKERGWTQAQLGAKLNPPVKQQQIQVWENSDNLEQLTLDRLAGAFGVSVIDLYAKPEPLRPDRLSPEERDVLKFIFENRQFYSALLDLHQLTKELPPEVADRLASALSQLLRPSHDPSESEIRRRR